ncbi:MAG TPA: glycosyltransferase family 4 protein [Vicinamibacterales bacterium]|nr:glycosyltransferase family 4 protein [Vicinamibacterales bacterium]
MRHRVAVVASHPIQYQAPWFRALAEAVDLEVFFCHRQDGAGQAAAGFGQAFDWDVPLFEGYRSSWLENRAREPSVDRFGGCDTPEVADRLADGRFDACIVSGWYLKSYLQAIRACRRLGVAVLSRGDSHLGGPRRTVTRAAKYLPYRWLLGRIDAHLFVGSANRAYLRHYGVPEERLFFAPHFVDRGWFAGRANEARRGGQASALRREWGIDPDGRVALFVGKLIDIKRPGDFVAAMGRLAADGARVHGVIVGAGPLEGRLRTAARAAGAPVTFAGFQNQSALPAYYAAADVLVLPSHAESWGLVCNEAMSCGVPIIVSDGVGAGRDLTDGRRTGLVYPAGDTSALAAAVRCMLEAVRLESEAVRQALATMMKRFSVEQAVEGTLAALAAVRPRSMAARA